MTRAMKTIDMKDGEMQEGLVWTVDQTEQTVECEGKEWKFDKPFTEYMILNQPTFLVKHDDGTISVATTSLFGDKRAAHELQFDSITNQ